TRLRRRADIGQTDALLDHRAHIATRDGAGASGTRADDVPVPGDPPILEHEADELPAQSLVLLTRQGVAAHEGVVHRHGEVEAGLERAGGLVDVLSPQGQTRLETQRVPGTETARGHTGFDQRLHERTTGLRLQAHFGALLTGVAGAGHLDGASFVLGGGDAKASWR